VYKSSTDAATEIFQNDIILLSKTRPKAMEKRKPVTHRLPSSRMRERRMAAGWSANVNH